MRLAQRADDIVGKQELHSQQPTLNSTLCLITIGTRLSHRMPFLGEASRGGVHSNTAPFNSTMPNRTRCLILDLTLGNRDYHLRVEASGPAFHTLDGRLMESGREVFTVHATAESEDAVKRILLAEAHRRSNQVFAGTAALSEWTCQAELP